MADQRNCKVETTLAPFNIGSEIMCLYMVIDLRNIRNFWKGNFFLEFRTIISRRLKNFDLAFCLTAVSDGSFQLGTRHVVSRLIINIRTNPYEITVGHVNNHKSETR
jgi:hypothetical protein